MKLIINENPQKYNWGQTNPLKSENPCPLPKPGGSIKTRGVTAYDLLKEQPTLKVKRTQSEVQSCCRPPFDHPKILHILIDRANGYGCKRLAKAHGGAHTGISKFCQSMGFDVIESKDKIRIKPDHDLMKEAINLMYAEMLNERRQVAKYDKNRHWGNSVHPAHLAWKTRRRWHTNEDYRNSRLAANISDEERGRRRAYAKQYNKDNAQKIAEYNRKYRELNPDKVRENARIQRRKPINRIKHNIQKRLRDYLKAPGASWDGFGCTSDELHDHLERQFTKGMTWDNYGTYWQVDHIRPKASFDLFDREQRKLVNHFTNLQPLEAEKNLKKSDKWDGQTTMFHGLT